MNFKFFAFILAAVVGLAAAVPAHAVPTSAQGASITFDGTQNGSSWTPVIAQTVKSTKGIMITNTSTNQFYVGINLSGSASSGDVAQLIISNAAAMPNPIYLPLAVSQGYRISIKNFDSTGGVYNGKFQVNALYN